MPVSYIAKTSDYWLRVQLDHGPIVSVPYGLKVQRTGKKEGREYFTILEGVNQGKLASINGAGAEPYFTTSISHGPGATVTFDSKSQSLTFAGRGPVNAFSGGGHRGFTAVSPGMYALAIPAYPSAQTRSAYGAWCHYHNLWFRIGVATTGSRFLHPGAISDGCVTVLQFVYDPSKGKPPAGFADLEPGAKTEPGLIGLPLPAAPAPCISWDVIVNALILARASDQAVGTLIVR